MFLPFCLVSPDSTIPSHQSWCQQTVPPRRAEHQGWGSGPHPTNPPSVTRPPACPAPPREALCIQRAETEVFSWCCSKSEYKRNVLHLNQVFGREMALCPLAWRIFLPTSCNYCVRPGCSLCQVSTNRQNTVGVKATRISP